MRLLAICLVVTCLALPREAEAQWSAPSGIVVTPAERLLPAVDVMRPQGVTWIDFSSGLLGAIIGFIIASTLCDETERGCPGGTGV